LSLQAHEASWPRRRGAMPTGTGEKLCARGRFFLHQGGISPISQLTRREKKPDEAVYG
jgi:hypothetical protein